MYNKTKENKQQTKKRNKFTIARTMGHRKAYSEFLLFYNYSFKKIIMVDLWF